MTRWQAKEKGGYRGLPWSPAETPLDFRGHPVHPPLFRQGALWPKTYLICQSSWEGGSPLPTAFAFKQLFLIANWNLQTAVWVLCISSFPPWRQEISCQHTPNRNSSQHTEPVPVVTFGEETDTEERGSMWILALLIIWMVSTIRNFHVLLTLKLITTLNTNPQCTKKKKWFLDLRQVFLCSPG